MQTIVSDTTTLIILGKIDRYDLLKNLFSKIYIPSIVVKEISAKSDGVYEKIIANSLFEVKEISNIELLKILDGLLDRGEIEAIILAKELNLILLIDEKKGRKIAKDMGLNIIGLLGVLILNVKKDFISRNEAFSILNEIKSMKFRVSKKLEEEFRKVLGLL